MPSAPYSFIDVAVLDGVRERFASGDAIVILSADLTELIWANGPGALLFGYEDIEAVGGAESGLSYASKRQITGTTGFPHIGSDRGVVLRLAQGMESRAYAFLASEIAMPDGEEAILLAIPAGLGARDEDIAERAIGGFAEPGHIAAFVDGRGGIEASSAGFEALGISPRTLAELAADSARSAKRVLKRVIPARGASLPAGMARLRDEPARHLLVVIDERATKQPGDWITPQVPIATPAPPAAMQTPVAQKPAVQAPSETRLVAGEEPVIRPTPVAEPLPLATTPDQPEPSALETPEATIIDPPVAKTVPRGLIEDREDDPLAEELGEQDLVWQRNAAQDAPIEPEVDRAASSLRFAWRTDAEGRFSAISPEFIWAVGEPNGNVVGRLFKDVSDALGLDPYSEIADLLERRDTWSGRSVLWPITSTDLRVPVDLAALPVYARDRSFEGFHGFGVARMGDAIVDSEAPPAPRSEDDHDAPAGTDDESDDRARFGMDDDPFRGETPALTIVPQPDRRQADKVIRLAEHRNGAPEKSLSPLERSAFREIGEKLRDGDGSVRQPAAHKDDASIAPQADQDFEVDPAAKVADAGLAPDPSTATDDQARAPDKNVAEGRPQATLTVEPPHATIAAEPAPAVPLPDPVAEPRQPAPPASKATAQAQVRSATPTSTETRRAHTSVDGAPARPSSADLLAEGFLPSAFSGPSAQRTKPFQDTPILSRLPVPLLVHSGDVLHYANDEFLALTGYDSVEQLGAAGGLGALFSERYDEAGGQDGDDRAIRLKTRDGLEFAIEALLRSVPWNGGKALMLVVRRTGDDDDSSVAAPPAAAFSVPPVDPVQPVDTSALKSRVAEMRTIIDTATDGVILIANDNTIRSISRPAEALFGFDTDELNGKPFVSLFAIESQRAARDYLVGLSDNGVASVLNDGREVIGREAQGRFIPLFMTIGKLPNESGYCAVVRDITQWKRAEEELTQAKAVAERASSQKTDFLARVSHEIRTPLNAIIGFSELMVDERFGPIANERYRDYLRDINRSGNHVLDLVNDLLDISKIEAGEQEMAHEAVSLNDTLAETVAMMQPQANRERVIIRSSFASRLPEVVADLRSVRQIALNILSNAIRYTQAGGQVIVSTAYELSGDVVIRVRDTGIGMSSAEIEQAMKPFKQINALKRGRGDGTGLGLPLTKAMVEANRARFAISSSPGDGTLVEVIFPSTRVLAD